MQLTRRHILANPSLGGVSLGPNRPKIAAIITEYRKFSHGQHVVDRFLGGYGWDG